MDTAHCQHVLSRHTTRMLVPEQCEVLCEVVVTGCTTYHYSMHMLVVDVVLVMTTSLHS